MSKKTTQKTEKKSAKTAASPSTKEVSRHAIAAKGTATYSELKNAIFATPEETTLVEEPVEIHDIFADYDLELVEEEEVENELEEDSGEEEKSLYPEDEKNLNSISLYFKEMGEIPLISQEVEVELSKKIRGGEEAIRAILLVNNYFVARFCEELRRYDSLESSVKNLLTVREDTEE